MTDDLFFSSHRLMDSGMLFEIKALVGEGVSGFFPFMIFKDHGVTITTGRGDSQG